MTDLQLATRVYWPAASRAITRYIRWAQSLARYPDNGGADKLALRDIDNAYNAFIEADGGVNHTRAKSATLYIATLQQLILVTPRWIGGLEPSLRDTYSSILTQLADAVS